MIDDLPIGMDGVTSTSVAKRTFEANEKSEQLEEERVQLFHHYVTKLLFLSKQDRSDFQTTVAFIYIRVQ